MKINDNEIKNLQASLTSLKENLAKCATNLKAKCAKNKAKKCKTAKASEMEVPEEEDDDMMEEVCSAVDSLSASMDYIFSSLDWIYRDINEIYNQFYKHQQGHLPALTVSGLSNLIEAAGEKKNFIVQPKIIYANTKHGKSFEIDLIKANDNK